MPAGVKPGRWRTCLGAHVGPPHGRKGARVQHRFGAGGSAGRNERETGCKGETIQGRMAEEEVVPSQGQGVIRLSPLLLSLSLSTLSRSLVGAGKLSGLGDEKWLYGSMWVIEFCYGDKRENGTGRIKTWDLMSSVATNSFSSLRLQHVLKMTVLQGKKSVRREWQHRQNLTLIFSMLHIVLMSICFCQTI